MNYPSTTLTFLEFVLSMSVYCYINFLFCRLRPRR